MVAVVFDHDPGWHVHTHDPQVPPELGDASLYIATEVAVEAGPALEPHAVLTQWPEPEVIQVAFTGGAGGLRGFGAGGGGLRAGLGRG